MGGGYVYCCFMKLLPLGALWIVPILSQGQAIRPDSAELPHPQYMLAPEDHILIRTSQAKKLDGRIFQIQPDGFVTLPTLGRVRAAGLTNKSLEQYLAGRLKKTLSGNANVIVNVVNFNSTPPDK